MPGPGPTKHRCSTCGRLEAYIPERCDNDGIFCGRYCSERCWQRSGYKVAQDPDYRNNPTLAGEAIEPEDY